jgi:hypothetical protein
MNSYKFSFVGRQSGAIGITYKIMEAYRANDINEALSLLYEDYELISQLRATEGSKDIEIPEDIKWIKVRRNSERKRKPSGQYV